MITYDEILATQPITDHQLPRPRVVEAINGVIDLDKLFTLEMPVVDADLYSEAIFIFLNSDHTSLPQIVVQAPVVADTPTQRVTDIRRLDPPFTTEHEVHVIGILRRKDTPGFVFTQNSPQYTFSRTDKA